MPNQNLEKNKADILQLANQQNLSRLRFAEETALATSLASWSSWRDMVR
jgi:hypothetical protein